MTDELLLELAALRESYTRPFPYDECRTAQRDDARYAALIPDLDSYFSELAGYLSWGKCILTWSDAKVETVLRRLEASFGERFPVYRELRTTLTDRSELRTALDIAERTRTVLLTVLRQVKMDRTAGSRKLL